VEEAVVMLERLFTTLLLAVPGFELVPDFICRCATNKIKQGQHGGGKRVVVDICAQHYKVAVATQELIQSSPI
jgi:hypothetical protein